MKLENLKLKSPSQLVSGLILGLNLSLLGCIEQSTVGYRYEEEIQNPGLDMGVDMGRVNEILRLDDFDEMPNFQKGNECVDLNPENGYCLSTCDNHEVVENSTLVNHIIFDEDSRYSDVYESYGRILVGCFDLCASRGIELSVGMHKNVYFKEFRAPLTRFTRNGWSIDEIVSRERYIENFAQGDCSRYKMEAKGTRVEYQGFSKGKESIGSTIAVDNYGSEDSRRILRRSIVLQENLNHFYYQFTGGDVNQINLYISTSEANKTNSEALVYATCNRDARIETISKGNTNFEEIMNNQRSLIFNRSLDFFESYAINIHGTGDFEGIKPNCKIEIIGNGNTFSEHDGRETFAERSFDM